uniref:AB hydrolase-1 domain-containing protein n=1 Tax=Esox lucius TaxID=8010 RepID=A0A3P8YQ95_ESOLU
MGTKKAVLFNLWGVVVSPGPAETFLKFEETHKLPRGFLGKVVANKDSAMKRAERGKLTLSQMIPEFDAECVNSASEQNVNLPDGFSVRSLLEELRERSTVNANVLQTAATLHREGLLTGVLANRWVDDSGCGSSSGRLLNLLAGHFDVVLQSCRTGHRVPEADLFTSALTQLGVSPNQALWLADDDEGVGAAEALGMTAVFVKDLTEALKQVEVFAGLQAIKGEILPAVCSTETVSHGYVSIKPGVKVHYVEMGAGPPVLLCHGFPESWYSWRYQIPALADAGFRVLALDMKGFGESTAPPDIEEYSQEQICQGIPQVTLVGHDWGGSFAWNMAQCHPERVQAVASLNTPLFPVDPSKNPMEFMKTVPIFDYQVYFQKPGVAEVELEKNLARTFKIFFRGNTFPRGVLFHVCVCVRACVHVGGLLVGLPEEIPRSSMLSENALQFYINQYKDKGFRGPLNWYRNTERNWKWLCSRPRAKLLMPALMVTAGKDPVLLPVFSKGMENLITNLTRGHIEECGHWTQMERPSELNTILISWLKDTHNNIGVAMTPKL